MNEFVIAVIVLSALIVGAGGWLGWQLLRQNGRMLLRLDELEKRLDELEFAEADEEPRNSRGGEPLSSQSSSLVARPDSQSLFTSTPTNRDGHDNRFNNRSLARSKIKRDGLKAGTSAPDFRLPCLDGSEVSLQDFRGRRVLLVFSDPHCGPCNHLAPQLEQFHRVRRDIDVVMISRGEPKENRAKVKEHKLTFLVLLQTRWEISRLYGIFATPVAYLTGKAGVIVSDVAVGVDPIPAMMNEANESFHEPTEALH